MSTARLVCSIMELVGNKLTHVGSTDTHSQLTFPTITGTVVYRGGYFYRLPEPEKILTNPLPENVPTNNVTIYCCSLSHRHHAACQQEARLQDTDPKPSATEGPMSTQAVLQQAGLLSDSLPIQALLTICRGLMRWAYHC